MPVIRPLHVLLAASLFSAAFIRAGEPVVHPEFEKILQPFLAANCNRCHGEKKQKGELRLDTLSRDFAGGGSAGHWADVMDRISSGEMPPEEEDKPKTEDVTRVVEWIAGRLK